MRFISFIIAGVFALAATAQSSTVESTGVASTTTTSDVTTTSEQAAITKCLDACAAGDVDCQAKCITVPSPDTTAVNETTECVANCNQGNGTAQDNENFANCRDACIAKYYYATSGGTPQATATGASGSSVSASSMVTAILSTITSGSSTFVSTVGSTTVAASPTGTGKSSDESSSSSTASGNAADGLLTPMAPVGFLSFVLAVLAFF